MKFQETNGVGLSAARALGPGQRSPNMRSCVDERYKKVDLRL